MGFFTKHDAVESAVSGIHIESVHDEAPAFKRLYTARLDDRASIKIDMHTFCGRRFKSGELTQPNGRWLLFDPDAVADKIIDPVLAPIVQRFVDEIKRLDKGFVASDPGEFIDQHGKMWRRVN